MKEKRKAWSNDEISLLQEVYGTIKADTQEKLENEYERLFPGRNYHSIKLKAFKSGLNTQKLEIDEQAIINDFSVNKLSYKDVLEKYDISHSSFYRLLDKYKVDRRKLTDFGNNEEFIFNYQTKTEDVLVNQYGTSWTNIKIHASNLRIKRPKFLIKYSEPSKLTAALLYDEYILNNNTSEKISIKYFNKKNSSSHVRSLLRKYGITKNKYIIQQQKIITRIKKYGGMHTPGIYGKVEKQLKDWLNSFNCNFKQKNWSILKTQDIDLYDENLALAVEYCGLRWHTECSLSPRKKYFHYNKYKKSLDKGIRLITIFEDEWIHRQEQVKSYLLSVLNRNQYKIYARKCTVKDITKEVANAFIEKYHIQGKNNRGIHFAGLYYNDELLGVMSFGRHHRKNHIITLDRLCFNTDYSIIGGSSKLFKYLVNKYNINEIISWSDNRWSQGKVYEKLGFVLDEELPVDYSYVDSKKQYVRVSKQSQKKTTTKCPSDKKEKDWAIEHGFWPIWDCGKKRWKWNK